MYTLSALALQCVIVWSPGTNGNALEKFQHEQAHCWGWTHPVRSSAFGAAYEAPSFYRLKGEFPNWTSPCGKKPCTNQEAQRLCKRLIGSATFGCFKF